MYLQYYMTHAIKTYITLHLFLPPKSSVSQCKPSHVLVSVTVTAGPSHYRLPKLTFIVFCEIWGFISTFIVFHTDFIGFCVLLQSFSTCWRFLK